MAGKALGSSWCKLRHYLPDDLGFVARVLVYEVVDAILGAKAACCLCVSPQENSSAVSESVTKQDHCDNGAVVPKEACSLCLYVQLVACG